MPGNATFGNLMGKPLLAFILSLLNLLNSEGSRGGDGDSWKCALLSSMHQHFPEPDGV